MEKLLFTLYLSIQDISANKTHINTKSSIHTDKIQTEGTLSQIFEIGLSLYFMKSRKWFSKNSINLPVC